MNSVEDKLQQIKVWSNKRNSDGLSHHKQEMRTENIFPVWSLHRSTWGEQEAVGQVLVLAVGGATLAVTHRHSGVHADTLRTSRNLWNWCHVLLKQTFHVFIHAGMCEQLHLVKLQLVPVNM